MKVSLEKIKEAGASVAKANGAIYATLFGSYARGTATDRSDVDIIFVEKTDQRFLRQLDRYLSPLVDQLGTSVETLVYTPEEFDRMKERAFVKQALKDGMVLHESGEV
ncbi:MAG TPA: nucleotidyltransferase domain-containing protein [Armatimonadota bacterium]|nr:nucleotidyltransferase domain-containing protein [Armatimonadota bacterium]